MAGPLPRGHRLLDPGHQRLPLAAAVLDRPPDRLARPGRPVASLVGTDDRALCTAAADETCAPVRVGAGVVEESGEFAFTVEQDLTPDGPPLRLRIDLSGRHFAATLQAVTAWWAEGLHHPGIAPAARMPAYSTWYSLHQNVDTAAVERQAALAAAVGCESIIVDDGWQTTDRARGYGHCGDWEPNPAAFPDPRPTSPRSTGSASPTSCGTHCRSSVSTTTPGTASRA